MHQLGNLFALQITETADAFKRKRFFVLRFFFPIVPCSALRRAAICGQRCCARALTHRITEPGETGKLSSERVANLIQWLVPAGG